MGIWIIRKWDGEEWPERRLSIADSDSQEALFISPRYADIDSDKVKFVFDMAAAAPDMYNKLADLADTMRGEALGLHLIVRDIDDLLAKARGEK